jgi:hypothetical protein
MLTDEDRKQIVLLQKENARRSLLEAQVMMDNNFWNAADTLYPQVEDFINRIEKLIDKE